jgi:hypothetical protein
MELVGTGLSCHDVDMATRDLDRLAQSVKRHRLELYGPRDAAVSASDVTKDTWQRVEEGRPVRESTYAAIERALGWATGSCIEVAEGGEPTLVDTAARGGSVAASGRLTAAAVRRAAFEAARKKLPMAAVGDIDAFSEEIVEVLRRAGEVLGDD